VEVKFTLHIHLVREEGKRFYEFFKIVEMPFAPFVGLNVYLLPEGNGYLSVDMIWFDPSGHHMLECDFGAAGDIIIEEKDWLTDLEWYRKQGFTVPND
jgi:hypothetical protein